MRSRSSGKAAGAIRNLRVPVGEGLVGSVARTGVAEIVNDVASDPRWRGDSAVFQTRAILTVPLVAEGRVIGVMQLLNPVERDRFTDGDQRRMSLFAGILAHHQLGVEPDPLSGGGEPREGSCGEPNGVANSTIGFQGYHVALAAGDDSLQ